MKKRLVLFGLVLILILGTLPPVSASPIMANDSAKEEYIASVLLGYLTVEDHVLGDNVFLTQAYPIYGNDSSDMYFVFDGDSYIGRLVVGMQGENYHSSFCFDENENIENAVVNQEGFAISAPTEYSLILQMSDESYLISGSSVDSAMSYAEISDFDYTVATLSEIDFSGVPSPAIDTSDFSVGLEVPFVANDLDDYNRGLCWAASICAISDYRGGKDITPYQLYKALETKYQSVPTGTSVWILRGFEYVGFSSSRVNPISWSSLYNKLYSGLPVMFNVARSGGAHSVVCRYFVGGDGYAIYGFMDPNVSSYVYITYNDASLSPGNFVYDNGQHSYNTWESFRNK